MTHKVFIVRTRADATTLERLLDEGWTIIHSTGAGSSVSMYGIVHYVLQKTAD